MLRYRNSHKVCSVRACRLSCCWALRGHGLGKAGDAFLAIKCAFFVCRVNCHLINVSSCRRLQPAAIKTPFEVVIKNDIKFNLQRWRRRVRLTVIGNVMSTVRFDVKIVFFVQIKLRFLLLNVVGAALSLYEYLVSVGYLI